MPIPAEKIASTMSAMFFSSRCQNFTRRNVRTCAGSGQDNLESVRSRRECAEPVIVPDLPRFGGKRRQPRGSPSDRAITSHATAYADGDSFRARVDGQERELRLYPVDMPEPDTQFPA